MELRVYRDLLFPRLPYFEGSFFDFNIKNINAKIATIKTILVVLWVKSSTFFILVLMALASQYNSLGSS